MRFLVDNALSPIVADGLRHAGHDAVHVRDYGLHTSSDELVLARAEAENRILVSADTDFGALMAIGGKRYPSIVLFRMSTQLRPQQQVALLAANLPSLEEPLTQGGLVVFEDSRVRVRALPIGSRS